MTNLSELQAIKIGETKLKNACGENWTISLMNINECEKFIWSYLYDNNLQYLSPINYGDNSVVLCHQQ